MLKNPKHILFESRDDIIDYVSGGLPPRKKHFNMLMQKVKNVPKENVESNTDITFSEELEDELATWDDQTYDMVYILDRVHENRCATRNSIIVIISFIMIYIIIGCLFGGGSNTDN